MPLTTSQLPRSRRTPSCRFNFQNGEIMSQLIDNDSTLQQAILAELSWDSSVSAAHIGVTVDAGIATLTGHVESFAQKHAAEAATRRVRGVEAVAVEIAVHLPFDSERADHHIAAAIVNRLDWDASVPRNSINVMVEKGWVSLSGVVDWHFQKSAAAQDVSRLRGVVGVSDHITVKPGVDVAHVREDIVRALKRSWSDPQRINVSASGGMIRLTGSARTPFDRDLAVMTAWAAPGAISVENDIKIGM
jgi:osmotically-inducible protein OsmY